MHLRKAFYLIAFLLLATLSPGARAEVPESCKIKDDGFAGLVVASHVIQGGAVSSVALDGVQKATYAIEVNIQPGPAPVRLVLSSISPVIWDFTGDVARIDRVAIYGPPVAFGKALAGTAHIASEKVTFVKFADCVEWKRKARADMPVGSVLKVTADGIRGESGIAAANSDLAPKIDPAVWEVFRRLHPGGIRSLKYTEVNAQVMASPYEVLPGWAGIVQQLDTGVLKYEKDYPWPTRLSPASPLLPDGILTNPAAFTFRIVNEMAAFPVELTAETAPRYIFKSGILPQGTPGGGCIYTDYSGGVSVPSAVRCSIYYQDPRTSDTQFRKSSAAGRQPRDNLETSMALPPIVMTGIRESLKKMNETPPTLPQPLPQPTPRQRFAVWGANSNGQLGVPGVEGGARMLPAWSETIAAALVPDFTTLEIVNRGHRSCMLRSDRTVWCWGDLAYFQDARNIGFKQVADLPPVVRLQQGTDQFCGTTEDGAIWCWNERISRRYEPQWLSERFEDADLAAFVRGFRQLSMDQKDTCALAGDNSVWCWKDNQNYLGMRRGNDNRVTLSMPIRIPLPMPAITVSTGTNRSCAILQDRTAACWINMLSPEPVLLSHVNVRQIESQQCMIAGDDASVWCWRKANDSTPESLQPVQMPDGKRLGGIAAISQFCGLGGDGSVYCWGGVRGTTEQQDYMIATKVMRPDSAEPLTQVQSLSAGPAMIAAGAHDGGSLSEDLSLAFMGAVQAGDFTRAREILVTGVVLKNAGDLTQQALASAFRQGRPDMVQAILLVLTPEQKMKAADLLLETGDSYGARRDTMRWRMVEALLRGGVPLKSPSRPGVDVKEHILTAFGADTSAAPLTRALREGSLGSQPEDIVAPLPLVPAKPRETCPAQGADAAALFGSFSVVMEGGFDAGKFIPGKVYKGYRLKPMPLVADDKPGALPSKALVLADFDGAAAVLGKCGRIFDLTRPSLDTLAAGLLAEAVLYEAALAAAPVPVVAPADDPPAPGDREASLKLSQTAQEYSRQYENRARTLQKNGDYLQLIEISAAMLESIWPHKWKSNLPKDDSMYRWEMQRAAGDKSLARELCAQALKTPGHLLPAWFNAQLPEIRTDENSHISTFKNGFGRLFETVAGEMSVALASIGEYAAALPAACRFGKDAVYIAAAKHFGRSDLVNGVTFGQIGSISGVDLSGLTLKRLQARGARLDRVDFSGSDLTNASFEGADLSTAKLDGAVLDLAVYNCRTAFPAGFDPVARHMLFLNTYPCQELPAPASNLEGLVLRPFFKERPQEYDRPKFDHTGLTNVTARQARLGPVSCKYCQLAKSDFTGAEIAFGLEKAKFSDTVFKEADLSGTTCKSTSFTNIDFKGANLTAASFDNCAFENVDFTGANLQSTFWTGSVYDDATIWPAGFDPQKSGLRKGTAEDLKRR